MRAFGDFDTFMSAHGDAVLEFNSEYGQPGGFGAQFRSHGGSWDTIAHHAETWNETHHYHSLFNCETEPGDGDGPRLCRELLPRLGTPALFQGEVYSTNFLVGGPESGLPLHNHEDTWQGLLSGRKAWYLVPPTGMTSELHDLTGPFMFPVRGWAKQVASLPLGQRPLYCVQEPGEVFFFPTSWFHGTLNLDRLQVTWGAKPKGRVSQENSPALQNIMKHFSASALSSLAADMPWFVTEKIEVYRHGDDCASSVQGIDEALHGIGKAALLAEEADPGNDAVAGLSAFAHCVSAWELEHPKEHLEKTCPKELRQSYATGWRREAARMSPVVAERECDGPH